MSAATWAQTAAPSAPAAPPTAQQISLGGQVWDDGGCANCHGAQGGGGVSVDFPVGPSLRTSKLDHAQMKETISCGRPGTPMPSWLKGAYTMTACLARPLGPPPSDLVNVGAYDDMQIEALVGFIQARFQQK